MAAFVTSYGPVADLVVVQPSTGQQVVSQFILVGEVVVSTIPAAAQTDDVVERCADVPVVFEVVYHPWPTPLARSVLDGRLSGAGRDQVLVTGLDLLVHQAALQFEQFTGFPAPLAAMRAALA